MKEAFDEVKASLEEALELIKKENLEMYNHLKDSIIMNEENYTFSYSPKDGEQVKMEELWK